MSIIKDINAVKEQYAMAAENGWVLPCICSENLTTTEAILSAAAGFGKRTGRKRVPVIIAITCNYDHRSQARYYTHTRDWATGLKLFTNDIKALADDDGFFSDIDVMIHLDHIQHDADIALLESDLTDYASIMYDASNLPFDENIRKTADFVSRKGRAILTEGACDEIVDATGTVHNALTTPEKALRYKQETGVDMIVANLGTEHRASGKELQYHGDLARKIKEVIGGKIVLHGTSSVTNDQVRNLFTDGICKVNIWTALERDASPALLEDMVRNAGKVAGGAMVDKLIVQGLLGAGAKAEDKQAISHFTTAYRQDIIFCQMKAMVDAYLEMWYL